MNSPMTSKKATKYVAISGQTHVGTGQVPGVGLRAGISAKATSNRFEFIFSKRGAYQKFKDLLERRKALERWYDFEVKATEQAVRKWCEENSIELVE